MVTPENAFGVTLMTLTCAIILVGHNGFKIPGNNSGYKNADNSLTVD
jgi:hypothetical protein